MVYIEKQFDIDSIVDASDDFYYDFNKSEKVLISLAIDNDFLVWPILNSEIECIPQHVLNIGDSKILLMISKELKDQYVLDLPKEVYVKILEWKKSASINKYFAKSISLEMAKSFELEHYFYSSASFNNNFIKKQLEEYWYIYDKNNSENLLHNKIKESDVFYNFYLKIKKIRDEFHKYINSNKNV